MSAEHRGSDDVNTDSWLTAAEVSDACNCSLQTITIYKRRDLLHPRKASRKLPDGTTRIVDVFDPRELPKLPRNRGSSIVSPGELAARAFEMFDNGRELKDVVVELRAEPSQVSTLYDQWMDLGGSEMVISRAAREELGKLVGPFVGVADLVQRVADLVARGAVTEVQEAHG